MVHARLNSITLHGHGLPLPAFFASVSSVKTRFSPLDYIRFLVATRASPFLVSAFDIHHMGGAAQDEALAALHNSRGGGAATLLDSGNYERYWHRNSTWRPRQFCSILARAATPLAFCYDNQEPAGDIDQDTEDIIGRVTSAQAVTNDTTVIAIVHGNRNVLPTLCLSVAKRLAPILVAVPERELGGGIIERIETVRAIRTSLDTTGAYVPLHLLGTGNPWSLALYTMAGADTFDGLEWCQTSVDANTGQLHHFSQADLFMDGASSAEAFAERTLLHNLAFYGDWMAQLQNAVSENRVQEFVTSRLPSQVVATLRTRGVM